jgi:hypothetical protein
MGEDERRGTSENPSVRRLGLTAAGILATLTLGLTLATSVRARPSAAHTCTATASSSGTRG